MSARHPVGSAPCRQRIPGAGADSSRPIRFRSFSWSLWRIMAGVGIGSERGGTFMTSRFDLTGLLAVSMLLIVPAAFGAQQLPPAAKQTAKTYGLDSFGKVDAIRYTFSIPGLVPPRTWEWQPETDTVTYEGKDKEGKPVKVTYRRSDIDNQSDVVKSQIDPGFVNDQYWLLLPLHVAWDGANVTDEGMHETPLGTPGTSMWARTTVSSK